ncbi:MAG: efflux RND transporter permease subunit, partial [Gammaproteobacteria bacterium]
MLKNFIVWSVQNRFLVLLLTLVVTAWGWIALQKTPLDAIPDLSDTQVIIRTSFAGQSPQVVEEQVTYPITTTMMSVPGAEVVRGYSFFGDSFVYVIFKDGTDVYWARSRVLEYLNQAAEDLPEGVRPRLGPDATGVGWIYNYVLVDKTGQNDLAQLRSLQDWFLKFELQSVPGVAEVATVGGMVKQYQVVLDPEKMRLFNIPIPAVTEAIRNANRDIGGSVIEMAEAEYMIRTRGYLKNLDDIEQIPLKVTRQGTPILLRDIARI